MPEKIDDSFKDEPLQKGAKEPILTTAKNSEQIYEPAVVQETAQPDEQIFDFNDAIKDDTVAHAPPINDTAKTPSWFANNWPWLLAAAVLAIGGGVFFIYIKYRKDDEDEKTNKPN